ncbi:MAG TPA: protease complex subunit PrcB family protein, partial [Trueperaceae bacterium]|nr:protease complex subunit PrcB family protein [Trueperaceae bacterium]
VDGQQLLRAPTPPLEAAPATASRIPQTTDMQLALAQAVGEVVYFDGTSYLSLTQGGESGVVQRVVPRPRFNRLRGIGMLTNPEADALADFLENGGQFVLTELRTETLPVRSIDGLAEHLNTGVYVQTEITTAQEAFRPAPQQLAWETIASGTQATGVQGARYQLISNQDQLIGVWSQVHATQLQQPPLPRVDFQRETLVAIFLGQRNTGGYGVTVRRVSVEGNDLYLDTEFREPAAGAITTQALTSPWTLVRVLRGGFEVAWVRDVANGTLRGAARATF